MRKIGVIAFSGGMDSSCLLVRMLREGYDKIVAVSFDYGQSNSIELERAKSLVQYLKDKGYCVEHNVLDMSGLGKLIKSALTGGKELPKGHYKDESMKATVIPNRNVIFSSIIYGVAQSLADESKEKVDIILGVQQGEDSLYLDSRPESRDACEAAFRISNYNSNLITYKTPYITFSKADILEDLLLSEKELDIDFDEVMKRTITSYDPDSEGRSSGTSSSDIKRIEGFIKIGRRDPIEYVGGWNKTVKNAEHILNK